MTSAELRKEVNRRMRGYKNKYDSTYLRVVTMITVANNVPVSEGVLIAWYNYCLSLLPPVD